MGNRWGHFRNGIAIVRNEAAHQSLVTVRVVESGRSTCRSNRDRWRSFTAFTSVSVTHKVKEQVDLIGKANFREETIENELIWPRNMMNSVCVRECGKKAERSFGKKTSTRPSELIAWDLKVAVCSRRACFPEREKDPFMVWSINCTLKSTTTPVSHDIWTSNEANWRKLCTKTCRMLAVPCRVMKEVDL